VGSEKDCDRWRVKGWGKKKTRVGLLGRKYDEGTVYALLLTTKSGDRLKRGGATQRRKKKKRPIGDE
jgi:hypothetical protein